MSNIMASNDKKPLNLIRHIFPANTLASESPQKQERELITMPDEITTRAQEFSKMKNRPKETVNNKKISDFFK